MPAVLRGIAFAVMVSALLSACGTVRGAGEDLQGAGRAVKRAAS